MSNERLKNNRKGVVWLVGSGPSDPFLLTIKAKYAIENANVVVFDNLVGDGILSMISPDSEKINVGKFKGNHPVPQNEINKILVEEAQKNKFVVRLKGGDPFVFGRGGEEIEELIKAKIPFEVVPGITSAVAVPAYCGIPVTHRDFTSSFHVITGHTKSMLEADIDYEALVRLKGTLIFLMGVGSMERICSKLIEHGMREDMPAAVLERGTQACQRKTISTVKNLYEESMKKNIKTPAIIVVGEVCLFGDIFEWASNRPLGNVKIAVTRPREKASILAEKLRLLGAEVVEMPSIKTQKIENNKVLCEGIKNIKKYTWICFTSPTGVKIFFDSLLENNFDTRSLASHKIAVVGSSTEKELKKYGLIADLKPKIFTGEQLGKELAKILTEKDFVMIPRAKYGKKELIFELDRCEIKYDDIPIYDTIHQPYPIDKFSENIDLVAFTSASAVEAFVWNKRKMNINMNNTKAVCIGRETAKAAMKENMEIFISPKATIDSMVEFIVDIFGNNRHEFV